MLNDVIYNSYRRDLLNNCQLVIDKSLNRIIGIVSCTYIDYSNKDFIDDIEKINNKLLLDYELKECFVINTKLYLRFLSPKIISGYAKGDCYAGNDISQIGIQLKNSMIGNSAVRIDYYIYRAICSNGLVVQAAEHKNMIKHSDKKESFINRLNDKLPPIIEDINKLPEILKSLVELEYSPISLANLGATEYIYKILPLDEYTYLKRNKMKREDKLKFDIEFISGIPRKYAGVNSKEVFLSKFRNNQSIFDFINIFTEFAHSKNISKKRQIYIEEKSGDLVKWAIDNKEYIENENIYSKEYGQVSLF